MQQPYLQGQHPQAQQYRHDLRHAQPRTNMHQVNMTPEAAAIAYIQSVAPPHVPPQPMYKFFAAKSNVQVFYGGGIDSAIDFDSQVKRRTPVKDEVTARQSAHEFSAFLNAARKDRQKTWDGYWRRKLDLNNDILEAEREAYTDSQLQVAEYDYSDDETPRRPRTAANVPVIQPNVGSFDLPKPRTVTIPDPRDVMAQLEASMYAQAQAQAHAQGHSSAQAQAQYQAMQQHHMRRR